MNTSFHDTVTCYIYTTYYSLNGDYIKSTEQLVPYNIGIDQFRIVYFI